VFLGVLLCLGWCGIGFCCLVMFVIFWGLLLAVLSLMNFDISGGLALNFECDFACFVELGGLVCCGIGFLLFWFVGAPGFGVL